MNRHSRQVNEVRRRAAVRLVACAMLALLAASGCASDERRAERLQRDAAERLDTGDVAGATERLEEIVARFPDTRAAQEARERLRVVRGLRDAIDKYPTHRTRDLLVQVGRALERFRAARGAYPASLAELAPEFLAEGNPSDVWGGALAYEVEEGGTGYRMLSLGADGAPGGSGDAEDLVVVNGRFRPGSPP